jgi:hypothetical protein
LVSKINNFTNKLLTHFSKWLVGQILVSKINNFTNKLLTHVSKWLVRQILVSKIDISLARAPDLTMTLLLLKCVSNLLVKA